MYNLTSSYYSKFLNISIFIYATKPKKKLKYLEFDGIESIVPGVLDKTIKALLHFSSDIKINMTMLLEATLVQSLTLKN